MSRVNTFMTRLLPQTHPYVVVAVALVLAFPWLPFVSFSLVGTANLGAYYAMVAVSIVVLTGWVGQISLGHAGLVGIGAYVTGHVVNGWHVSYPVNLLWAGLASGAVAVFLGMVAVRVRGLYLAVATLIFSWMASEFLFRQNWLTKNGNIELKPVGEPDTFPYFDFHSRRTYYYVAWAAVAAAIYLMANLRDSKTGRSFFAVRGSEVAAASLGISVVRTKITAFALSGALAGIAGNMLIVRDRVVTPDAFRVEVSLFFVAVAVVGGLSSLGGAVAGALLFAALNEVFFRVEAFAGWLEVVPPVLLTGALLLYRGGLAAVPEGFRRTVLPRVEPVLTRLQDRLAPARKRLREAIKGVPKSVHLPSVSLQRRRPQRWRTAPSRRTEAAAAPPPARPWTDRLPAPVKKLFDRVGSTGAVPAEPRLDLAEIVQGAVPSSNGSTPQPAVEATPEPEAAREPSALELPGGGSATWRTIQLPPVDLPPDREDRKVLIAAEGVTVRFGGLVAANNVSLTVREHEIVGLIGPNGAGKTTTFNAMAGLNVPSAGRIMIYGHDVTNWTVDQRARLGVGRTFQAIQLLPQLTVFDNLLVATHVHNPSGLLSHLFVGPATLAAEHEGRRQVRQVAQLLELEEYLDRRVMDLPFGVLRMVEVARALVTGARLMMLDEPASGLDNTETDRLAAILRFVRNLGVTILLIEHDVKMVTSVSDYMYVLEYGALLAEGTAADVQRDPRVIAAYLGEEATDEVPEEAMV